MTPRRALLVHAALAVLSLLAGCSPGDTDPGPHDPPLASAAAAATTPAPGYSIYRAGNRYAAPIGDRYVDEVQPALAARCAVCHACTNGPCQLNMTSYAALERGVSSVNPYHFGLFDSFPTRVADNRPLQHWRDRGFQSILPGPGVAPVDSVFFRALELGDRNTPGATPTDGPLPLALVREMARAQDEGDLECPATAAAFDWFALRHPQGGMPWALPTDPEAHATLEAWVLDGAPAPAPAALATLRRPQTTAMSQIDPDALIAQWEAFFDADDLRSQLVARYVFEHVYSANIHFDENPGEFYRLVRSRTAAPAPIDHIFTDMPQDDPGPGRVHYRLEKIDRVIEGKVHVWWELGLGDLAHLRELFLGGTWTVSQLPGYASRNPFEVFEPIPAAVRSRFMLENARMLYATFARGPICLIQDASHAVDEHFWILFVRPESDPTVQVPRLGLPSYATFFSKDGNLVSGVPVLGDKYGEPVYRAAFEKTLRQLRPGGLGIDDIWTGDGTNPNAWLTVHRNQISVDVLTTEDRPITGLPDSVWLITYANFERMYYNAVAQYKFWGSLKHQNDSFNWQIYTRTEAEDLWASLFPGQSYRNQLRDRFTSFQGKVYHKLFKDYAWGRPSASPWLTSEDQLGRALLERMGPGVIRSVDRLSRWPDASLPAVVAPTIATPAAFEAGLRTLTNRVAPFAGYVPNIVHVRVGGEHLYTILGVRADRGDKIASSAAEGWSRERWNDYIVAVPGFSGYEAHMFVDLAWADAPAFLTELGAVHDQATWAAFEARYKIGRGSPQFWPFVDWLHHWMELHIPVRAALLVLRAYDKDALPF